MLHSKWKMWIGTAKDKMDWIYHISGAETGRQSPLHNEDDKNHTCFYKE